MTEKTLGYVELEWTCTSCGTKNPGTTRSCSNCGRPMGEAVAFDLPAQQELITDEEKLDRAGKGADLLCPYCGTRNLATAPVCTQCGGDLKDAKAREAGKVLGAYSSRPAATITCPACGTANTASAPRCVNCGASLVNEPAQQAVAPRQAAPKRSPWLWIGLAVFGVLVCVALGAVLAQGTKTTTTLATVREVHWERSIQILELLPVEYETWEDRVPEDARLDACRERLRETLSEPVPDAVEVCGTPYTVDEGSGIGRVEQECEYQVYDDWCAYTVDEWQVSDSAVLQGGDQNLAWPALSLEEDQRQGERRESYAVTFFTEPDGKVYTMQTSDPEEFMQFTPGSRWELEVNGFGSLVGVDPK